MKEFEKINKGFNAAFQAGRLGIGLVVPIENYEKGPVPSMKEHVEMAQLADEMGFKSLWVRDVPFNVPSFGDAGQTFDPFTYLGYLSAVTHNIALCVGSIALPLHHPLHVAKSAATIDQLSGGRLILGVASGDRPQEYPAMGIDFEERGELFRQSFSYIRQAAEDFPHSEESTYGQYNGQMDVLPKPTGHKIPMLVTGHSRQSLDWIAKEGDGWLYYPRNIGQQLYTINQWRDKIPTQQAFDKPFAQPLYVDLHEDDDYKPVPIHLGFRIGMKYLIEFFRLLQNVGVNQVLINLRFNSAPMASSMEKIATHLMPHFHIKEENISA
ncbi:MAG: LLM class oxidoreductase [Bacteroidota bacterium]